MTHISNSTIQPWLDFRDGNLPSTVPLCTYVEPGNCTQVCNSSTAILDPIAPDNLLTCGLWSTLTMLAYYPEGFAPLPRDRVNSLLQRFEPLGLDASNATYAYSARGAVSNSLSTIYDVTTLQVSYRGDTARGIACSQQMLFPILAHTFSTDLPYRLSQCVDAICSRRTLNPDLGGVGVSLVSCTPVIVVRYWFWKVFVSLLLQLCVAITIFAVLAALEIWPSSKERMNRNHMLAFTTATMEHHKNQCYFISAIIIAALVLNRQAWNRFANNEPPPAFDVFLSVPLSMNGFLPVTFILACIARYGRLTWHIIILSLISIGLSTGTLAGSTYWILKLASAYGPDLLSVNEAEVGFYEDIEIVKQVCGSQSWILTDVLDRTDLKFSLIWAIYSYCILWFLWCMFKHVLNQPFTEKHRDRVLRKLNGSSNSISSNELLQKTLSGLGLILLIIWALCFTYHFYLYSLFAKSKLVSSEWSFGQIIAVTVWIPSIVELLYIELGRFFPVR